MINRALSIREPYASLVIDGHRPIDERTWEHAPTFRGRLAIHASSSRQYLKGDDWDEIELLCDKAGLVSEEVHASACPGHILGTAELVDVIDYCDVAPMRSAARDKVASKYGLTWKQIDQWVGAAWWLFILKDPVRFSRPIPASGKLNIWTMDDQLARSVASAEQRIALR